MLKELNTIRPIWAMKNRKRKAQVFISNQKIDTNSKLTIPQMLLC